MEKLGLWRVLNPKGFFMEALVVCLTNYYQRVSGRGQRSYGYIYYGPSVARMVRDGLIIRGVGGWKLHPSTSRKCPSVLV